LTCQEKNWGTSRLSPFSPAATIMASPGWCASTVERLEDEDQESSLSAPVPTRRGIGRGKRKGCRKNIPDPRLAPKAGANLGHPPLHPNLVLPADATVQGRVTDQTNAPLKNSPIELIRYVSESKQERVKKLATDAEGKFDLGTVKRGEYRLLLSPHRGFKQPEKLECSSRACTLDAVLIVNPSDQLASSCPIR
jgi:hypothetical protein